MKFLYLAFLVYISMLGNTIESVDNSQYEISLAKFDNEFHTIIDSVNQITNNQKLSYIIYEKSCKYNFNPVIIARMIKVESQLDSSVVQKKTGALGLTQIMPSTAKNYKFDINRIFQKEYNIDCGLLVLYDNMKVYGTLEKALAAYHGGHKRALRWPHGEQGKTKYYVEQILGD